MHTVLRSAHKKNEYKKQNIYAWLFILIQALIVAMLIFVLFLTPARVNGSSMSPTLKEQDVLLIDKLTLFMRAPKRGDLVIFSHKEAEEELIKRIIALPGETIEIKDGNVYINGLMLDESVYMPARAADFPLTLVEEGTVFVLGDDRAQSLDSRALGAIAMSDIDGRVRFRVAPIGRVALFL